MLRLRCQTYEAHPNDRDRRQASFTICASHHRDLRLDIRKSELRRRLIAAASAKGECASDGGAAEQRRWPLGQAQQGPSATLSSNWFHVSAGLKDCATSAPARGCRYALQNPRSEHLGTGRQRRQFVLWQLTQSGTQRNASSSCFVGPPSRVIFCRSVARRRYSAWPWLLAGSRGRKRHVVATVVAHGWYVTLQTGEDLHAA